MATTLNASGPATALSMRVLLDVLEEAGEIVAGEREVDWDLEMGAIARRCYETGAPAPLFTNVRDARHGFRAIGAPVGVSRKPGRELARIALALGLPAGASARDIVEALDAARAGELVAPAVIASAPCRQNVWRGDELALTSLPIPLLHAGDGGRYLNTLG